jgi:hypothetical protein
LTAVASVDDLFGVQVNSEDFGGRHGLVGGGRWRPFALHEAQRGLPSVVTADGKSSAGSVVAGSQCRMVELQGKRLRVSAIVGQHAAPVDAQQLVQTLGGAQRDVGHFRGGWCGQRVEVQLSRGGVADVNAV